VTEPKEPITLYGSKAARVRETRDQLEDEYGVQPTNPAGVFELAKRWAEPSQSQTVATSESRIAPSEVVIASVSCTR
jgi:hypothetical protein